MDYIKACDEQFTLTTKKSLHITFKASRGPSAIAELLVTDDLIIFFVNCNAVDCEQTIAYDILWDVKLLLRYSNVHIMIVYILASQLLKL